MSAQTPIQKLLVANRGEIAKRLFRACREIGIQSVAAYSDADAGSAWSRQAEMSIRLPGTSAAETYLNAEALLAAAREVGADAIHPGYGFLSESADFAAACLEAGITFVGPSPEAMRALADKSTARRAALSAGVPVVPGFAADGASDEELTAQAERVGYPVMIKASGGAGGRGLRTVDRAAGFADALRSARAEALMTSGSDNVLIEKRLSPVRHVEVQILGDHYGNVLHLFERECSIQRRHQKIVEESPSPGIGDDLRSRMTSAAVALAKAVGYYSAGTVEFLVDADGQFYFLEANPRLQVEHPVTETVCGIDIAVWQMRIASGSPLALSQDSLTQRGHAIECRVYAEDPAAGFAPATGTLAIYRPPSGPGVRCDDGVTSGSVISKHYDSLIAKIITTGWNRDEALRRMRQALSEMVALGVATNLQYLQDIVTHPAFVGGNTTTGFIEEHFSAWRPATAVSEQDWLAMAAFESLSPAASGLRPANGSSGLAADPWALAGSWRNVP